MKQSCTKRSFKDKGPMFKLLRHSLRIAVIVMGCLMHMLVANAQNTQGETYRLSGNVTSASGGEVLPGVNVLVKGTQTGTVTDIDGNFNLNVSTDDVLLISFIGHLTQEIPVNEKTNISVSLEEDIAQLDEIVVVGYGEMKRSDMSSAQTSIGSEEIEKTVNTTIEQAIQGRAAGVYVTQNTGQPGGGISVNIRGVNSINGSNEPLYVIDGVQIAPPRVEYGTASSTNPLVGINPADIESMEILQGPSATAIYGSRGTNGVILITTKRGKSGMMNINYEFLYSLQDKPNPLPVMNLRQYAQMTNEYHEIAGGDSPGAFLDPSLLGEGTNWQNELFRQAPLLKHQLSLSGGNENTTFYLSGEFFDQEGVAIGSSFDRYSMRLNVDNQTRDWLKLGANLNVSQTDEVMGTTQDNLINNALSLPPNIPIQNPDGSWGGADVLNGSSVQFTPLNPIAIANLNQNDRMRRQFLGGVNAEVKIFDGLVFRTNLNTNVTYGNLSYFQPTWQIGDKLNETAILQERNEMSSSWNWNQLLQYTKSFGRHNLGLMASHESQGSYWENLTAERRGFVTNEIPDLNIGSLQGATNGGGKGDWAMESYFGRANYNFDERYIIQAAIRADGSSNFGPENRWGIFPSVSAAWRVSEESFMDGVSLINELKLRVERGVTGNQGNGGIFTPLRSVTTPWGAGFIAERYGNPNLQWEETLTNNIGFNLAMFENRIQLEGDFYIKETNNLLMNNPLPDYMGTAGEGSIGTPTVNIGALENRGYAITLSTVNIDRGAFTWKSNFNISGFRTKITEFYSEAAFVDRTAWYLDNWTQRATIGEAPWLFRGYVYDGIFSSVEEIENSALPTNSEGGELAVGENSVWVGDIKYKDINEDGVIDERDQTYIGNPWPKFSFGFTNTFNYRGFDLTVLLTGSYGNDIFNYLRFTNTNPNNINLGRNLLEETFEYARVIEDESGNPMLENPETDIPRISATNTNGNAARFTDKFVEDGSYIRVKNVQLSYNFPSSLISQQSVIQGLRLSAGVQNLATFTKYKGYDPEVGAYVGRDVDPNNQAIGLDFGRYPLTPVYTFSVGVSF
ncbi:SusC/RagA family TonB-linked outer membrane protein [Catalinimonas niigatensis]|uniref:SusC/RagA family TonB-linked outer membrane protein n=1 Tax=Catalinimonas niigatensis TaxID=1397264 RepID=UPI002664F72C|nr:TonB-dependent receptor [Catalinimonas niigatensis]WPP50707.1 TonB-dependent receptor [Catalinimonas niigatensis]